MALFRVQNIHLIIQDINKNKKIGQKVRNNCVENRNGGHDVREAVFMLQGPCSVYISSFESVL